LEYQWDADLSPKYIKGDAMSIGEVYDAAKRQALELAILNLASTIEKNITDLIDNRVANGQLGQGEAVSLAQTVSGSKNIVSKRLQRLVPVVECYRTLSNKNVEVRVVVFYDYKTAQKVAADALKKEIKENKRAELGANAEELVKSVDKLLGI
jgi:hypothetical protein